MEFDVLDLQSGEFLDTPSRDELLRGLPVVPVKVMFAGKPKEEAQLLEMLAASHFVSPQAEANLCRSAEALGLEPAQIIGQSDVTGLMEGLYIKVEEDGVVKERLKFVRRDFITRILESDGHWMERPIVPNVLRDGVDIFDPDACLRGGNAQ
jgi:hypothetical protein